jgi:hypothetical protein
MLEAMGNRTPETGWSPFETKEASVKPTPNAATAAGPARMPRNRRSALSKSVRRLS